MRSWESVFWLLVPLALASCRSVDQTRGPRLGSIELPPFPPFFEVYDSPSSDEWDDPAEGREVFVRPFGSYETADRDKSRLNVLLPLLDFRFHADRAEYRILPVFRYSWRLKESGGIDWDWMLFPFFFAGDDPEEGGYFAFLPFGGKLRGLLAQDEVDFVLFPIYLRMRSGEKVSTHIFFPFGNTTRGEGWSGWRFWPFYGGYEQKTATGGPRTERFFVLWPFYIRNREFLNRDPTDVFFTFPFYGRRENSRSLTQSYLWPFLVVHHDKRRRKKLVGGYAFPYRFQEGQYDFWPLFGWKTTLAGDEDKAVTLGEEIPRERFRQFALWPLQRYERAEDAREVTTRSWVLPVYWRYDSVDKLTLDHTKRWKLWPFCGYEEHNGDVRFDLFSPLWFYRAKYDRLYGRLFSIFRYRSRTEYRGWEFLYGTLYWHETKEETIFSILGGLLELGQREGSFLLRIFYIPWW